MSYLSFYIFSHTQPSVTGQRVNSQTGYMLLKNDAFVFMKTSVNLKLPVFLFESVI